MLYAISKNAELDALRSGYLLMDEALLEIYNVVTCDGAKHRLHLQTIMLAWCIEKAGVTINNP